MSESGAEAAPAAAKELLALNPAQESDFRKKVQEVKKKKSGKVGETCGLEGDPIVCSYFSFVYCRLVYSKTAYVSLCSLCLTLVQVPWHLYRLVFFTLSVGPRAAYLLRFTDVRQAHLKKEEEMTSCLKLLSLRTEKKINVITVKK